MKPEQLEATKLRLTAVILALTNTAALGNLTMRFDEGAPKDRFTLKNTGTCALPAMQITLDLGTAPAGLIFDVTGAGADDAVFQPFELVSGAEHLNTTQRWWTGTARLSWTCTDWGLHRRSP